jgi:hypothetical protein
MASVIQVTAFGTNETSGTPATQSFSTHPSTGNQVIVAVPQSNNFTPGTVTSCTDNQSGSPNTYVRMAPEQIDGEGGVNCSVEYWWCENITYVSGTFTVSVSISGTANTAQIALMETNGYTTIDQYGGAGTTANPLDAVASAANAHANCLELALCAVSFGASAISNPAWLTSAEATAWSNTWALGTGSGGGSPNQASYRIASGIDTAQAYWNWTEAESGAGQVITLAPVVPPPLLGQALT